MISFDFSRFIKNCPGTCYFQGKNNCFSTIIDKNKVYGIIVKYHLKRLKIPFCLSLDLPIFCHFLWILFAVIIRSHQNFAQTYKFKVYYGVFLKHSRWCESLSYDDFVFFDKTLYQGWIKFYARFKFKFFDLMA